MVTLNVQVSPGLRAPPVKLREVVPDMVDPIPQISVNGRPVAANPVSAALRSSVKASAVTSAGASAGFSMVNSSVAVPPGAAGSSVNSLVKLIEPPVTVSVSVAESPVTVLPPTVAVISLVVLV